MEHKLPLNAASSDLYFTSAMTHNGNLRPFPSGKSPVHCHHPQKSSMNQSPEKIFFAGAEKIDWALNEDLRLLQATLGPAGKAESLSDATVVHSVWWGGLLEIPRDRLAGKKIVCQFDNPPYHWVKQASFRDARQMVGLWVTQSRQATAQARTLGLPHAFVPYKLNTETFRRRTDDERRAVRASLGIPTDAYVIGNFHRDTEGGDLARPKSQKNPQLLLEIAVALRNRGVPAHVLLAGPRRHWLREALARANVPFTFAGERVNGDDIKTNILPRPRVAELYGALDLCLVTSLWEGGPYSILEAAATGTPVLSTRVGLAEDLLEPASLFSNLSEAVAKLADDEGRAKLASLRDPYANRVAQRHTVEAVAPQVTEMAQRLKEIAPYAPAVADTATPARPPSLSLWDKGRKALGLPPRHSGLTVSFFREFVKPPYGGGNQFMLALKTGFEELGVRVLVNEVAEHIDGYFFDSLWFDEKLLAKLERIANPVVVHRIDGPIHLYRGKDKEIDDQIFAVNTRLATSTVIQSDFTLEKVFQTGYRPVRPVVIRNAANPAIFRAPANKPAPDGRKIRIVATSWSDNPNKGGPVYKWLEENLDWNRYEFTFVGRCSETLNKARVVAPVASEKLAALLQEQDIYLTASQNDPCSNALIEAMSCGLPAIALRSGGHPELVGAGGLCFDRAEEIPACLDAIGADYDAYRRLLTPPSLREVAERYLALVKEP